MGTPAAPATTVFVPVSTGPWLTVPVGSNIAVGDTLKIGTAGRREDVKVLHVGTPGATGTGVDLSAPLKFDHAAGIDVSDVGTGVSFSPVSRYPHRSGDTVRALGSGLTLDAALARGHDSGAAVMNPTDTTAGYQGLPSPNLRFGETLSTSAGSLALMDASGQLMVDAVVYGSQQSNSSGNGTIASPEIAVQISDQGKGGCIVVMPNAPTGPPTAVVAKISTNRSFGRYPDGVDTGSICVDFKTQAATTLPVGAAAGASNIKVAGVADFQARQTIFIDTGESIETAVIDTVGTAGASTISTATETGATVLPVTNIMGFAVGQTIFVGGGNEGETAVIASISGGRGGARISVAAPLAKAHSSGTPVSGSGITLSTALSRPHGAGTQVVRNLPTPNAPNRY